MSLSRGSSLCQASILRSATPSLVSRLMTQPEIWNNFVIFSFGLAFLPVFFVRFARSGCLVFFAMANLLNILVLEKFATAPTLQVARRLESQLDGFYLGFNHRHSP